MIKRPGWNYWKVADLIKNDIIEIGDGYRAKNSEMSFSGLPFARAGNVKEGFNFNDADLLSKESVLKAKKSRKVSCPGDITFTSKGTFGRFALVKDNTPQFVYSPQLCYWRIKNNLWFNNRFLYYWMQGSDCMNQMRQLKGLTDMADYISLTSQRKMWLSAPPLPTQNKIAAILSAYDDLIENNTRRIEILEEMAQALYREWFVEFRFPGHEDVAMVEAGDGRMVPEGWEVKKIEDLCSKLASGGTPTRKETEYWTNGTIDWYKTKELQDNFLFDSEEKISIDGLKNSSAKLFSEGTLIVALYAAPTLGRLGVLTKPSTFNQAACGLIPDENLCNMPYLYLALLNSRKYFYSLAMGAAQQNINVKKLRETPIILPNKGIMDDFGKFATSIFEKIQITTNQNLLLKETRDFLLPRLIEGLIDVSDLRISCVDVDN